MQIFTLAAAGTQTPRAQTEGITIADTFETDNILNYLTYIQYTTNDQYEEEGTFLVTTTQAIQFVTGQLNVSEHININTTLYDYSTIQDKSYNYTINSTSNIPANMTSDFPAVFNGGWQHNYPAQSSQITLNNQEISYTFKKARDIDLIYQKDTELVFENMKISVQQFTGSLEFEVTCGSG